MASETVGTAVRGLKAVGAEITQWENRLEFVKQEVEKNTKARDSLLAEIAKKTDDFNGYMAMKDAEIKQSRTAMLAEKDELAKQKAEFQAILEQHRKDKEALSDDRKNFEIEKQKSAASAQNIQDFIQAVRRAAGLLGI